MPASQPSSTVTIDHSRVSHVAYTASQWVNDFLRTYSRDFGQVVPRMQPLRTAPAPIAKANKLMIELEEVSTCLGEKRDQLCFVCAVFNVRECLMIRIFNPQKKEKERKKKKTKESERLCPCFSEDLID